MLIAERGYSSDTVGYRFGFNGQERDDEVSGEGDHLSFKYRIHDARLGRFLSVDPLSWEYPWNSTYAFAENTVILAKDLEGAEKYIGTINTNSDGTTEIKITLSTTESIKEQQASGMAMISWNGGEFTNDFRYQEIQEVLGKSQFLNGDLVTPTGSGQTDYVKLNSGGNPSGTPNYLPGGSSTGTNAPHYLVNLVYKDGVPTTTTSNSVVNLEEFGAPSEDRTGFSDRTFEINYSAGVSVAGSITYSLGVEGYEDYTWDISIVDQDGNVIWSKQNATTNGKDVSEDIDLPLGAQTLKVIVQKSEGTVVPPDTDEVWGGKSANGWYLNLEIEQENVDQ